jgi:hypothetical protein
LQLSPAYIVDGGSLAGGTPNTPDGLIILSGAGAGLTTPESATTVAAGSLTLPSNLGVTSNDLIFGASQTTAGTCSIVQVSNTGLNNPLTPTGTYSGSFASLVNTAAEFTDLGPAPAAGTSSQLNFKAITLGVDPSISAPTANDVRASLMSYDMLTGVVQTLSDNVINMKMRYLVNNGGTLLTTPATGAFSFANLSNNSSASQTNIRTLEGIRLVLVIQNGEPDTTSATPPTNATLNLFNDTGAPTIMTFTAAQRRYHYKVIDLMIPFRNIQIDGGKC